MRRLAVCAAAFLGVFSVDLNGADGKILGADGNGKFLAIGDIPDYGQTYLSPDFVKPGGGKLFITCRTGDKLLVLEGGKVEKEVLLPQHPSGLAVSPDGKTAWVSIAAPRGELVKIDVESGEVVGRVRAGHMPRAVELSPDNKILYVANQFENLVRAYDAETLEHLKSGKTIREPFSIAVSPDGRRLYVANQLPEAKGGLYEENIAASASVLDADTLEDIARVDLPNGSINVQGVAVSPDGKYVCLTHVVARFNVPTTQVERGWINTNAISIIDTSDNSLFATVLLDDVELGAANPYGLTFAEGGKTLAVVCAGTHELIKIDFGSLIKKLREDFSASPDKAKKRDDICNSIPYISAFKKRISLPGLGPRHLVECDGALYVAMYYSDDLCRFDLKTGKSEIISIGGNSEMNEIRRGDLYYHDAALCFQKWLSCVTCHTEVRSDSLNWDLLNDGIGNPKQSKSMLYAHFTPPSMITGVRANAKLCVRKGIRYIQFTRRPEKDAAAIDQYMMALKPVDSPHLVDGKLSEAAELGAALFELAKCSACHTGEYLTDMKMHDVGTGLAEYENKPFDTPTLCEVWRTAPYLYDGRARTVFEMLKFFNKGDKHGKTSDLSDDELRDLEAFVLSL